MGWVRLAREILVPAPRHRVWRLVVDHERMPEWFPAAEVVRRRPGRPDPDGVGAERVVRVRGLAVEERITAFKPEERLEYDLVAGAPVRECRGEVVLTPVSGHTRVRWSLTLRPRIPGFDWLARRFADAILRDALDGLARRARLD